MASPLPDPSKQPSPSARKQATDQPGQSEGMPVKTPAAGRPRPGRTETPADASDEASLALPHERDQSIDMTDAQADPQVQQASRDLRRGLQDTGKSVPMDKAYDRLKR
ncbi:MULTISPECIES: hypothetical protein [unclassified Polaromonas]|uniref:hypothetical protein n=1 Tax=unclassified Polaromonas TaxID=2638319 RepID=UPI0025ED516B|nr:MULTISPECIES: hypothetical protein [unclassified Polaromonas]HQR97341.1 hypothetical protein [Polaromonas sp.]HQS39672.1 hypothetical protein [Polaromonas sp.]HQS87170.1 hypothetical protein [Polaromonas sp.]HQT08811.1 hypothetical protein [Polaromonas sp.]